MQVNGKGSAPRTDQHRTGGQDGEGQGARSAWGFRRVTRHPISKGSYGQPCLTGLDFKMAVG